MGLRRDGREAAIQFLYQVDAHKPANVDEALDAFWKQNDEPKNVRDFATDLLRGALEKLPEVDAKIRTLADNWDLNDLRWWTEIFCGWRSMRCCSVRRFLRWSRSTRRLRSRRNSARLSRAACERPPRPGEEGPAPPCSAGGGVIDMRRGLLIVFALAGLGMVVRAGDSAAAHVFVGGEVNQVGAVEIPEGGKLTVVKAITLSGGLGDFADPHKIRILRRNVDGTSMVIKVDWTEIMGNDDPKHATPVRLEKDVEVKPGDTILVAKREINR